MSAASDNTPVGTAERPPFGLPMGTIRGTLALLICGFVWMVLLWDQSNQHVKLPLAHFFLGSMVFMAFVSHPGVQPAGERSITPWLLRVLFAGGSVGVVMFAVSTNDWHRVTERLVPDVEEFKLWWLSFLGVTVGGFLIGRLLRLVFGNASPFFQSVRAWLSVLALLMMLAEFLLFIAYVSAPDRRPEVFMHVWQAVQLAAVSAYFGSRT